jgi:hypothetical protein
LRINEKFLFYHSFLELSPVPSPILPFSANSLPASFTLDRYLFAGISASGCLEELAHRTEDLLESFFAEHQPKKFQ